MGVYNNTFTYTVFTVLVTGKYKFSIISYGVAKGFGYVGRVCKYSSICKLPTVGKCAAINGRSIGKYKVLRFKALVAIVYGKIRVRLRVKYRDTVGGIVTIVITFCN